MGKGLGLITGKKDVICMKTLLHGLDGVGRNDECCMIAQRRLNSVLKKIDSLSIEVSIRYQLILNHHVSHLVSLVFRETYVAPPQLKTPTWPLGDRKHYKDSLGAQQCRQSKKKIARTKIIHRRKMSGHSHDHGHSHEGQDHGHSHEILDGPGSFLGREMPIIEGRDFKERAFTVGIGGYVALSVISCHVQE